MKHQREEPPTLTPGWSPERRVTYEEQGPLVPQPVAVGELGPGDVFRWRYGKCGAEYVKLRDANEGTIRVRRLPRGPDSYVFNALEPVYVVRRAEE